MSELTTPIEVFRHLSAADSELMKVIFEEEIEFIQLTFENDKRLLLVSIDEVPLAEPGQDRYPFSRRLTELAIDHFEETNELPDWIQGLFDYTAARSRS